MIHFVAVGLDEISLATLTENSFFRLEAVFIFSQAIFPLSQVETNNLMTCCSKILDPSLHINTTRLLETFQPLKAGNCLQNKVPRGFKSLDAGAKSTPKSLRKKEQDEEKVGQSVMFSSRTFSD